jgi:outer membrane lipoprotein SlyB
MKKLFLSLGALSLVAGTVALPSAADARKHRTYYKCKRSKGTTGTIAGGVGGALIGNAIGGDALGTVAGGVGGALLGRHLDRNHDRAQNRRNGC